MISQSGALRFAKALLEAERDMNCRLTFEQDVICRLMEVINVAEEQHE